MGLFKGFSALMECILNYFIWLTLSSFSVLGVDVFAYVILRYWLKNSHTICLVCITPLELLLWCYVCMGGAPKNLIISFMACDEHLCSLYTVVHMMVSCTYLSFLYSCLKFNSTILKSSSATHRLLFKVPQIFSGMNNGKYMSIISSWLVIIKLVTNNFWICTMVFSTC